MSFRGAPAPPDPRARPFSARSRPLDAPASHLTTSYFSRTALLGGPAGAPEGPRAGQRRAVGAAPDVARPRIGPPVDPLRAGPEGRRADFTLTAWREGGELLPSWQPSHSRLAPRMTADVRHATLPLLRRRPARRGRPVHRLRLRLPLRPETPDGLAPDQAHHRLRPHDAGADRVRRRLRAWGAGLHGGPAAFRGRPGRLGVLLLPDPVAAALGVGGRAGHGQPHRDHAHPQGPPRDGAAVLDLLPPDLHPALRPGRMGRRLLRLRRQRRPDPRPLHRGAGPQQPQRVRHGLRRPQRADDAGPRRGHQGRGGPPPGAQMTRGDAMPTDPFAAKRAAMREEFFSRHFLLGGWLGGTDTYKRTMW